MEVLSATTAAFDRGQKFAIYRQLPSLREYCVLIEQEKFAIYRQLPSLWEYVLIEQDRMSVERFRRDERNRWVLQAYGPGDRVELSSLDFGTTIESLYEDVALPAPDEPWRLPEENTD